MKPKFPIDQFAVLTPVLAGQAVTVVGSAPIVGSLELSPTVLAVNGGISTVPEGHPVAAWVVNSRSAQFESWGPGKVALSRQMLAQARQRTVGTICFLAREDGAPAITSRLLRAQKTVWSASLALTQIERREIERLAGGRGNDMDREALSAGLSAACFAFAAGAATVRLVGFSWAPGYEYAPEVKLATRGHAWTDKKALANLEARYGDRLVHSLTLRRHDRRRAQETVMSTRSTPRPNRPSAPAPAAAGSDQPQQPQRRQAPIMVQATKMGFYSLARRRPGDVFQLRDPSHFSERWMVRVADDTPPQLTHPRAAMHQANREAAKTTRTPRLEPNAADVMENRTLVQQAQFPAGSNPLDGDDTL